MKTKVVELETGASLIAGGMYKLEVNRHFNRITSFFELPNRASQNSEVIVFKKLTKLQKMQFPNHA